MRTYKIIIAYDGSRYQGWQRQALTDRTIQQVLEESAGELLGYPVELSGSGRTDGGVHARGQVASMKVAGLLEGSFMEEWNHILPEDIRVLDLILMPGSFHARYSAVGKRYCYLVDTREVPSVFHRRYACHYPKTLNVNAMRAASGLLVGTHDFTAFTDDKSEKSKVRTIYGIEIAVAGPLVELSFCGTGFLYHMVRILTGTLLQIGIGEKSVDDIPKMLEQKERSLSGFLAPAKGLCLEEVYYEEKKR